MRGDQDNSITKTAAKKQTRRTRGARVRLIHLESMNIPSPPQPIPLRWQLPVRPNELDKGRLCVKRDVSHPHRKTSRKLIKRNPITGAKLQPLHLCPIPMASREHVSNISRLLQPFGMNKPSHGVRG